MIEIYLTNTPVRAASVLPRAKLTVVRIFARVGLSLEWRRGNAPDFTSLPAVSHRVVDAIEIQFDSPMPPTFHPGALAYAAPFGKRGARIHVFFDRIGDQYQFEIVGTVLGHVIAHEVTHVLEGIDRHSAHGLMKAHWDTRDLRLMLFEPLALDADDVELIYACILRTMAFGYDGHALGPQSTPTNEVIRRFQ